MSQPIYVVLELRDPVEDVQGMIAELMRDDNEAVLDVGGYRFNDVRIQRVGTVSP